MQGGVGFWDHPLCPLIGKMLSCLRIHGNFSINISKIILDDLVNRTFIRLIIFFIGEFIAGSDDSSQVGAGIVSFFRIKQKPLVKLSERIVRIVKGCQHTVCHCTTVHSFQLVYFDTVEAETPRACAISLFV